MLRKFFLKRGVSTNLFRFTILFFAASGLLTLSVVKGFAQTPTGYTLVKANLSSSDGNLSWQWIATNNTPRSDECLILENLPVGLEILSVSEYGSASPGFSSKLPLAGPASLVVGPFPVPANSSVTFLVDASQQGTTITAASDTFALVPQSRLTAGQVSALTSGSSSQTPNFSARGLILSAVAGPNVSRNGQPVNFFVNLSSTGSINLALFTLSGERLFTTQVEGNAGSNTVAWGLENENHIGVAAGLYLYYLQVTGSDGTRETRVGKIAVLQ